MPGFRGTLWERFWPKVREGRAYKNLGPCWIWTAGLDTSGYGHIGLEGRCLLAHRVSYRWWKGPIPRWLELDHLCFRAACVNPAHLEPVTRAVQMQRYSAHVQASPVCKRGHRYDEGDNTYLLPNGDRRCRRCQRERNHQFYERRKLYDGGDFPEKTVIVP